MMVGQEVRRCPRPRDAGRGVQTEVTGLRAVGDRGTEALRGVELTARSARSWGSPGSRETASANWPRASRGCAGARGRIVLDGTDVTGRQGRRARRGHGIVPEERMRDS